MNNIDIHTHGGFGVNFNTASEEEIHKYARKILAYNTVAFCPTLASDSIKNLRKQIETITSAMQNQKPNEAKILGIHLEACFLNPQKRGIHNQEYFLDLTPKNFDKLGDTSAVKIVTLAPELDKGLISYLKDKNIIVHAGHTLANDVDEVDGLTHTFNAMPELDHRNETITSKALLDDDLYCEIIGDERHVSPDLLKIFFRVKPQNRVILISDSLPIAHSQKKSVVFCDRTISQNGMNLNGTLAGSVKTLGEITDSLVKKGYLTHEQAEMSAYENPLRHLDIKL